MLSGAPSELHRLFQADFIADIGWLRKLTTLCLANSLSSSPKFATVSADPSATGDISGWPSSGRMLSRDGGWGAEGSKDGVEVTCWRLMVSILARMPASRRVSSRSCAFRSLRYSSRVCISLDNSKSRIAKTIPPASNARQHKKSCCSRSTFKNYFPGNDSCHSRNR